MVSTKKHEVQQLLAAAAAACEDKKAEDIRILALDPSESGLTDYFLICTGMSDRQNVAITDEIEIRLKRDFGTYPNSVEGRRQGEWVLMDYVDFIVHVFSEEKRAFYGLERLRKSATVLSIADLNSEIKAAIASTRKKPASEALNGPAKKAVPTKKAVSKKQLPGAKTTVKKIPPAEKTGAKNTVPAKKAVVKTSKKTISANRPPKGPAPAKSTRRTSTSKALPTKSK